MLEGVRAGVEVALAAEGLGDRVVHPEPTPFFARVTSAVDDVTRTTDTTRPSLVVSVSPTPTYFHRNVLAEPPV